MCYHFSWFEQPNHSFYKTPRPRHHNMPGCTYQVAYVYTISRPVVQTTVTYWSVTVISRNPRDYSFFLGGSGCDFQDAFFNIVFLIGNFRSTPESAFTWISQDLLHDKITWLQLMAWCHQCKKAITPDIIWANVDPNLCRFMALLARWVHLSHFKEA